MKEAKNKARSSKFGTHWSMMESKSNNKKMRNSKKLEKQNNNKK